MTNLRYGPYHMGRLNSGNFRKFIRRLEFLFLTSQYEGTYKEVQKNAKISTGNRVFFNDLQSSRNKITRVQEIPFKTSSGVKNVVGQNWPLIHGQRWKTVRTLIRRRNLIEGRAILVVCSIIYLY